jgi:hypothetical protein
MIHSNPDNSALSKLGYFKFCRCDAETLGNIIMYKSNQIPAGFYKIQVKYLK